MPINKISILSTRPLDASLITLAANDGITITVLPFIETSFISSTAITIRINNLAAANAVIVFTSMNAVEAVHQQLRSQPSAWKIYCMGAATKKLVAQYFGKEAIAGTARDAKALAAVIIKDAMSQKIIFFCGDRRRDELPQALAAQGILVDEIIVYHTNTVSHVIEKPYDGILFFSPSAVESFFLNNRAGDKTIFFAIGKTTAATIKRFSDNTTIISEAPAQAQLVQQVITFFKTHPIHH